jgi:hypothetical protein
MMLLVFVYTELYSPVGNSRRIFFNFEASHFRLKFVLYSSVSGSYSETQGCGSGSGLDPDSETLWIRIRIRIGNPDPDPGARKLRNFSGKKHYYNYFLKEI